MKQVLSFFMAALFAIFNLLGLSFPASDLQAIQPNEAVATEENIELFKLIFETETAWLASLQLDNGAIPMTYSKNGELRMSPYFADFAALALLDNAEKYAGSVKKYMDWHFDHLNTAKTDYNGLDGTIYDYVITMTDGKVTGERITETDGKKSYDSTDSYAATFLMVLNKYYEKTQDSEYILSHKKDIERIVNVMFATMHNGLTYAKPDHKIKYLMDNCEVYEAAVDAAELFENVICANDESFNGTLEKCNDAADEIKKAINEDFWNHIGGYYYPEITPHGIPSKIFLWDRYYPCATAQLFPIICGVIEPNTERANSLYNNFCNTYSWEKFDIPDDFYWGANVYAAAVMNDLDRVVSYMTEYTNLLDEHKYPIYNADSARASMAAYIMLQRNAK